MEIIKFISSSSKKATELIKNLTGNLNFVISIIYVSVFSFFSVISSLSLMDENQQTAKNIIGGIGVLLLISNAFLLPRIVRYCDRSSSIRAYTPMEAIWLSLSFIVSTTIFLLNKDIEGYRILYFGTAIILTFSTIGLFINYRRQLKISGISNGVPVVYEDSFNIVLEKIVSSDAFLSSLHTALPKTEKNDESMEKHVPFILASIRDRRSNHEATSKVFFTALVLFSLLFSGFISYFGFILIDKVEIGLGKYIDEVDGKLRFLKSYKYKYEDIAREYFKIEGSFLNILDSNIEFVENLENSEKDYWIDRTKSRRYSNISGIEEYYSVSDESLFLTRTKSILDITHAIKSSINRLSSKSIVSKIDTNELSDNLSLIESRINELRRKIKKFMDRDEKIRSQILELLKDVRKENIDPGHKVYTLLKRLSVGLIVGSFFLAILRYLAQQYSIHAQKVDQADKDELALRKFYVSYDMARGDNESWRELLRQFTSQEVRSDLSGSTSPGDIENSKLDAGDKKIISEILEIIKKKI